MPVGNERGTVEALPGTCADPSGKAVAGESDRSGDGEYREVARRDRIEEASHRLDAGQARVEADRGDDNEPRGARPLLTAG